MACDCIKVSFSESDAAPTIYELNPAGQYLGINYFEFPYFGSGGGIITLWYKPSSGGGWIATIDGVGAETGVIATAEAITKPPCPIEIWTIISPKVTFLEVTECEAGCDILQDRTFKKYDSIRLPEIFEEQDRGYFRCCCPFDVLAGGGSETWKNDVTSAWIKLSSPSDSATAILYKNGVPAIYEPIESAFVNEANAFYWTIPWIDVLNSDGIGCYHLEISYNIAGIQQAFTWGIYNLKPYSIQNALKTARVRVIFDSQQEIEGINFSGSQVEDSIRFFGYIGNRQPNTEIDNLIYQNREVKKVVRENLNTYEILVDPTCDDHIKKLTDLYLLSENQLFISDYNAHNPSYRYLDTPAIVQESPEIIYYDFSREAGLKCIVGDKFKNQRSYYK
jgi:hypothetical protein